MFLGVRATIRDMQLRGEEIKYKISHPDCWECNMRKTTGYYGEEEDDGEEEPDDDLMKIFEIVNRKRHLYDPFPEEQGYFTPEEVIEIAKRIYHMAKRSEDRK